MACQGKTSVSRAECQWRPLPPCFLGPHRSLGTVALSGNGGKNMDVFVGALNKKLARADSITTKRLVLTAPRSLKMKQTSVPFNQYTVACL